MATQVPRTRSSRDVTPWALLWKKDKGWGIVRRLIDEHGYARLEIRMSLMDLIEDGPGMSQKDAETVEPEGPVGEAYFPDMDEAEPFDGPLPLMLEQIKHRGMVEATIARSADPTMTAIDVGWRTVLLRDSIPRTFPALSAIVAWDCQDIFEEALSEVREWGNHVIRAIHDWSHVDLKALRRRHVRSLGVLQSHKHVLARIVSSTMDADFQDLIGARRADDEGELLTKLEAELVRAATTKGAQGARRRFIANLILARRQWGPDFKQAWDEAKAAGEQLVKDRVAEMATEG